MTTKWSDFEGLSASEAVAKLRSEGKNEGPWDPALELKEGYDRRAAVYHERSAFQHVMLALAECAKAVNKFESEARYWLPNRQPLNKKAEFIVEALVSLGLSVAFSGDFLVIYGWAQ